MEKRELLEKIHTLQAEKMLEILEGEHVTAQELNAITKFLADNGIDLQSTVKPVQKLAKHLKFRDPELDETRRKAL